MKAKKKPSSCCQNSLRAFDFSIFQEFCSHPQVSHFPSFLLENAGSSTGVKFGKSGLNGLQSLSPQRPSSSKRRAPQAFEQPQQLLSQEFPPQNSNNNRMIQFIGSSTYHCLFTILFRFFQLVPVHTPFMLYQFLFDKLKGFLFALFCQHFQHIQKLCLCLRMDRGLICAPIIIIQR